MAEILISMYPIYTQTIISGQKTTDFRRSVVNELLNGGRHTAYLYETKKNRGVGKVVGQADVKDVFVIVKAGIFPKLEGLTVENMQRMYLIWCRQTGRNPAEWWYTDKEFTKYRRIIGWSGDPEHYYNYALKLDNIKQYDTPLDVTAFVYPDSGKIITRPPRNICICQLR